MNWNQFFFSNVGQKIKKIIRFCFYVEVILILITGVVLELVALANLFDWGDYFYLLVMLLIPVGAAIAIGALWLSTLLTYGFAEIVDTAIVNRQEQKQSTQPPVAPAAVPPTGYRPVAPVPVPAAVPVAAPAPAKPYYDVSQSKKPSVGVGKCPICKQVGVELWECVLKEGSRYSQKNICQGCIDTYQKAAKP